MENLKPCPDCGSQPVVRTLKTVHGLDSGILIECQNKECPGISGIVNRYAYSKFAWNQKLPRHPICAETTP